MDIVDVKIKRIKKMDNGYFLSYIDCPYCGYEHHHGGSEGGPRVPHCSSDIKKGFPGRGGESSKQYNLVPQL